MSIVLRKDLKSIGLLSSCSLLFSQIPGKSTEFSRTYILRDALRLTGEQAHWVYYKQNLDYVQSSTALL